MARIQIINDSSTELTLDTLIPAYGDNKEALDVYKKTCESQNKKIKELMRDTKTYETGGYRAVMSVVTTHSMNEEKLIDVLKAHSVGYEEDIIKVKEYVDMEELESAIYNGKISKDILMEIDKCRETKETTTLRVNKVKEKKDGKN